MGAVLAVAGSAVGSGALGGTPIAQASDGALSAAALATSSIDLSVLSPTAWAGVVVAVAAVIASLTSVRLSGLAWTGLGVAAASAWGLAGIAVGRATEGPSSSVTTVLAAVAATVVLAVGVVAGLRSEASRGRTGRSTGQQTGR